MYEYLQYIHIVVFGLLFCTQRKWRLVGLLLTASGILYLLMSPQMEMWNEQRLTKSYTTRACIDSAMAFVLARSGTSIARKQALILVCLAVLNIWAATEYRTDMMIAYTIYTATANALNVLQLWVVEDGYRNIWRYVKERVFVSGDSRLSSVRDNIKPK